MNRLKDQAIHLRLEGWAYRDIMQRLNVPKSTLSGWLSSVPYTPNAFVRQRMREGPYKSVLTRSRRRLKSIDQQHLLAVNDIGEFSARDLFMVGIGLYMGEGVKSRESTRFVNSNPQIIKLMIRWFRDVCGLEDDNFSVWIHGYPDTDFTAARDFWAECTGLAVTCFRKCVVDSRQGKHAYRQGKWPHGTLHLQVKCNGNKDRGVMLHRRIMGWIDAVYRQVRV